MNYLLFFTSDALWQEILLQIIIKFILWLLELVYTIIKDSPIIRDLVSTIITWLEYIRYIFSRYLINFYCINMVYYLQKRHHPF